MPPNAKDGLARIRASLDKLPAFTEAYDTARKAYQAQASAPQPSTTQPAYAPQATGAPQGVSPYDPSLAQGYAPQAVAPPYDYGYDPGYYGWAPDYYYGYGPGWIAPTPWAWWAPCGFWGGCNFFPFGATFCFGGSHDFDHSHHGYGYNNFAHNQAMWHGGGHGSASFYGAPAHASSTFSQWNHQGFHGGSTVATTGSSLHWSGGTGQGGTWNGTSRSTWSGSTVSRSPMVARGAGAPMTRAWSGSPKSFAGGSSMRNTYSAQSFRGPMYSAPRSVSPNMGSFHASRSAPSFSAPMGGSFNGGMAGHSSMGGGFHGGGGGFSGGFHGGGGGFGGGGHGGGGHR